MTNETKIPEGCPTTDIDPYADEFLADHLARAEATALLNALIERVERFELTAEPQWYLNNVLHGVSSLPVRVVPAA